MSALLEVRDLSISFATDGGVLRALDGVSFDVPAGGAVALVGESGCGKSVTAHAILRLLPEAVATVESGSVVFDGADLLRLSERAMCAVRGGRIGMVFQEPMTSLNPVYTVGAQIAEAARLHLPLSRAEAARRAVEALGQAGFPDPQQGVRRFPHELSGGLRQRVMIAMALVCRPALLLADEPTTALDATTAARILALLRRLRAELGMAMVLVSHDLSLVASACEEIVVLYAGQVVERGTSAAVLGAPRHPYTRALLASVPPSGPLPQRARGERGRRLSAIEGAPPDLRAPRRGCPFAPRCPEAFAACHVDAPPLYPAGDGVARCLLHAPERARLEVVP